MASLPLSVSAEKISSAAEALINLSAGRNSAVLSRPDADQQSQEWDRVSHLFENPPTIPHTQKISCGDDQNNSNSTSTAQIRRWRSTGRTRREHHQRHPHVGERRGGKWRGRHLLAPRNRYELGQVRHERPPTSQDDVKKGGEGK
jgi:hypothetical protein